MATFILALYVFVIFGASYNYVMSITEGTRDKAIGIFLLYLPVMGLAFINMVEKVILWTS